MSAISKSFKKDAYSQVFAALKHPVRRQIMRMLAEGSKSYTELLISLGIDSPRLNYHLQALGDLVNKNERGEYCLSRLGEAAFRLIGEVKAPILSSRLKVWEKIQVVGIILVVAGITFILVSQIRREQSPGWLITEIQGILYHVISKPTQTYPFNWFFNFGVILIAVSMVLMVLTTFKSHNSNF